MEFLDDFETAWVLTGPLRGKGVSSGENRSQGTLARCRGSKLKATYGG